MRILGKILKYCLWLLLLLALLFLLTMLSWWLEWPLGTGLGFFFGDDVESLSEIFFDEGFFKKVFAFENFVHSFIFDFDGKFFEFGADRSLSFGIREAMNIRKRDFFRKFQ